MAQDPKASMPQDWNDHAGWDAHYQSKIAQPRHDVWDDGTGSIDVGQLPRLAEDLKAHGWRSVWVPGCGLSPLAWLLANLGLHVVASDVSPAAVRFQQGAAARRFDHLTAKLPSVELPGSFRAEVHDFRKEFRREAFDLIINVKAIQAFTPEDMTAIARVHASALRPGRMAYFDTMNVQGERRDQLEQALEDGGFVVPFFSCNRWYRQALRESGLPHMFILGRPFIPRTGNFSDGGPEWEAGMDRLRGITAEYQRRMEAEFESENARILPETKTARVIYSTG